MSLQQELDAAKEDLAREKDMAARRAREDEEELQILRDRCEQLESERGRGGDVRLNPMVVCFVINGIIAGGSGDSGATSIRHGGSDGRALGSIATKRRAHDCQRFRFGGHPGPRFTTQGVQAKIRTSKDRASQRQR